MLQSPQMPAYSGLKMCYPKDLKLINIIKYLNFQVTVHQILNFKVSAHSATSHFLLTFVDAFTTLKGKAHVAVLKAH